VLRHVPAEVAVEFGVVGRFGQHGRRLAPGVAAINPHPRSPRRLMAIFDLHKVPHES
jgi:hypothetical protein